MIAGNATPPHAATTGNAAFFTLDKWPCNISYFISHPTTKKILPLKDHLLVDVN